MSEQKNSFLYIGENGKADWGVPEGYPYKDGVTIEWDGNTEGLDVVGGAFYRVSDVVLSDEQIKAGFIKDSSDLELPIAPMWDKLASDGMITDDISIIKSVAFVRKGNVSFNGVVFKTAGVYFANINNYYVMKFTNETIHPIAAEFLPKSIGNSAYIINVTMDENENYIADKTYSEISEALMNGQIPYCIFGEAVFYMMESSSLLTTYRTDYSHDFLNINPLSLNITRIIIKDNNNITFNKLGTITVTTQ